MKNFLWAVGSVIVSVLIAILFIGFMHDEKSASLGAISSPSTNLDYLVLSQALGFTTPGNPTTVNMTAVRSALTTGSNIPCVVQNPFNATSSIMSVAFNVSSSSATSFTIAIGTSTVSTATSSVLTSGTIGANTQGTITWDPSSNNGVIAPNGYITGGTNNGSLVGFGGSCTALFVTDN